MLGVQIPSSPFFLLAMLDATISIATLNLPTVISILLIVANLLVKIFIRNKEEIMKNSKGVSCCDVGT